MTTREMTISPIEFSYDDLPSDDAEFLRNKAAYINARRHLNHQLVVEMGQALIAAKERLPGVFLAWARHEFKHSDDTTENWMNVAREMPALPDNTPSTMYQLKALYELTKGKATDESRAQAGELAESGQVVDYQTAYILVNAPVEVKGRFLEQTITKPDAFNLTKALNSKKTPPAVKAVCLTQGVTSPELVDYLAQAYNDVSKGRETWGDIVKDNYQLNGLGWSVPLAQARVVDIERFKVDRAVMHRDNAPKQFAWIEFDASVQENEQGGAYILIARKDLDKVKNKSVRVQIRLPIAEGWD